MGTPECYYLVNHDHPTSSNRFDEKCEYSLRPLRSSNYYPSESARKLVALLVNLEIKPVNQSAWIIIVGENVSCMVYYENEDTLSYYEEKFKAKKLEELVLIKLGISKKVIYDLLQ